MSDVRLNLWLSRDEYDRIHNLAEQEKRSDASMARYLLGLGCDAFEKSLSAGIAPTVALSAIAATAAGLLAPLGLAGAVAGAAGLAGRAVAAGLRGSKRSSDKQRAASAREPEVNRKRP